MGQKNSNTMIFNEGAGGRGRNDLSPVCKWTGTPTPDPAPAPVPDDRDNVTVTPEEWDYFLAFLESRARGHSCGCTGDFCNEIEAPGKHFHPPNPATVTFDCTLWKAAYWHSEDQAIQNYCPRCQGRNEPTDARGAGWRRGAMGAHCLPGLQPPRWPWGASWPAILPGPLQQHVQSGHQRLRRGPLVTKHRTGCLDSYVQPWWQRHLRLGELHPRGLHCHGGSEVSIHSPHVTT